ncbi:IclR family transcriptional regulator [Niallia circulans]|uniref:IclR family transcriptional regulator n=1 Tax=Niallia circulans TaxID=1397 RepID=A0A553SLS9_NIACI|nr:IclR family transcriptional regulator [Niallia circulans]TRZ37953.1 IclR family transcriptional regulator [Niallia circulans]
MEKQLYGTVLLKADRILAYLADCQEPQALYTIAKETELTNSTALKILETLNYIGYVQKDTELKKFSLGPTIIKYANRAIQHLDIKEIAQPHLEALQAETGETVHLGIQDKTNIVYIAKIESKNPICLYSKVGKSIPIYCSAMGKAVLAERGDDEVESYLDNNELVKMTENTITTKAGFRKEIASIRSLGYASDNCEHEEEVFCIGASISINEKNYGAISVSTPKYRVSEEFEQKVIKAVQSCQAKIKKDIIASL